MRVKCFVASCKVKYDKKVNNLSFHRFPLDETLRNKWIKAIGRKDAVVYKASMICSRHFEEHCYIKNGWSDRKALIPGSVPSLFNSDAENKAEEPIPNQKRFDLVTPEEEGLTELTPDVCEPDVILVEPTTLTPTIEILPGGIRLPMFDSIMENLGENSLEPSPQPLPEPSLASRLERNSTRKNMYAPRVSISELATASTKRRRLIEKFTMALSLKRKEIKKLRQQKKRLLKRMETQEQMVKELLEKSSVDDDLCTVLTKETPAEVKAIIDRMLKKKATRVCSEKLCDFAITLNSLSPKAYEYVRRVLFTALPDPRTLQKWARAVGRESGANGPVENMETETPADGNESESAANNIHFLIPEGNEV